MDRHNCMIDWEGVKVVDRETDTCMRWVKEAIWIKKTTSYEERHRGAKDSVTVWDSLLTTPSGEQ